MKDMSSEEFCFHKKTIDGNQWLCTLPVGHKGNHCCTVYWN